MSTRIRLLAVCIAALFLIAMSYPHPKERHEALVTEGISTLYREVPSSTSTVPSIPKTTTTPRIIPHPPARVTIPTQPAPTSTTQPGSSGGVATAWGGTGCMVNAQQTAAQAHACWDGLIAGPADSPYTWSTSRAFSVMMCESHGNPWAHNSSGANGLMQDLNGPMDPAQNMAVAYGKYKSSGWGPWNQSESCWISARNG